MRQLSIKRGLLILLFLIPTAFVGCGFSTSDWELTKAKEAEEKKQYNEAIQFYYKYLRKNLDSQKSIEPALKIYQIAKINSLDSTLIEKSLKHVILRSNDQEIRMKAQFDLAEYYFSRLNNYEMAINHFNKYLFLSNKPENQNLARLKVAKSYFYLNNFYQATVELEEILKSKPSKTLKFDAQLLMANVLQSEKKYSEAIGVYESILTDFPARAEKELIFMNLAFVLEDNKDFDEAIEVLKKYREKHKDPAYIESKIKKIEFLISQQPGARGRVK